MGLLAFATYGASTVPWNDDFEGYTNNQPLNGVNGWVAATNTVKVQNSLVRSGTNASIVPSEASVSNTFSDAKAKVWVDFYTQRTFRDQAPAVANNETAVFYFNESSNAVIRNGATWVTNTTDVFGGAAGKYGTGTWVRITVCLNYTTRKWAFFVQDELLGQDLSFVDQTVTGFEWMAITNKAYLDDMYITTTYPTNNGELVGDLDGDSMPDAWEVHYWGNITSEGPGDDADSDGRTSQQEYNDGTNPTVPNNYTTWDLPYVEFFEDQSAGASVHGWRGLWANALSAVFQDTSAAEGSQGMGISSGEVALTISDANTDGSNVWCQIYMKPVLYSGTPDSSLAGTNAAAFCVTTDGDLLAYSSTTWSNCGTVATNQWLGFAVHLDYANSNWDLYASAAAYYSPGRLFTKMNDTPLGFNNASPAKAEFAQMVITNGSTDSTYVDAMAVSLAIRKCDATLTNLVAVDRIANASSMCGVPPYDYADKSLNAGTTLSLDLSRNLDGANNDPDIAETIRFFDATNGWSLCILDASTNWQSQVGVDEVDARLKPGIALWMDRGGVRDAVTFYPFADEPTYTATVLYGTNNAVHRGWNFLAWPYVRETRSVNDAAGLGFTESAGCKLYIYEDNRYRKLWYNTSASAWFESRSQSSYQLKPGQGFWFYRAENGTENWNP